MELNEKLIPIGFEYFQVETGEAYMICEFDFAKFAPATGQKDSGLPRVGSVFA